MVLGRFFVVLGGPGEGLGRLLGHLGVVFGDVGRSWGHHESHEAVLDALSRNMAGRPGSLLGQKGPKMAPKMGPKTHQNRTRK